MKKLDASELKNLNLLKHYRIIRKWASKNNNLREADLELLIYLDCIDLFTKKDFELGVYSYSWDNRRWSRLIKNDWIKVWRNRNRTTPPNDAEVRDQGEAQPISRIYKIMLKEEELPTSVRRNKIMKGNSYMDKVLKKSIYEVNKDNH